MRRNPAKINWATKTEELLASGKFPKKAKWSEIVRYLKNNGVTDDEVEMIFGVDVDPDASYTADQIREYVAQFPGIGNAIYSDAIPDFIPMKGDKGILVHIHEATGSRAGEAKYSDSGYLVVPGGQWHQEMVLYSRALEPYPSSGAAHYGTTGGSTPIVWVRFQYRQNEEDAWVLFIDEIQQSDRLKAGKRGDQRSFRRRPSKRLGEGWAVESDVFPASVVFSAEDHRKHLLKVYHRYQDYIERIPEALVALGYSGDEVESAYGKMGNPDRMEPGTSLLERFAAYEEAIFTFLDGPLENLPQQVVDHLYGTTGQKPPARWDPSEFMTLVNEILGEKVFTKSYFKDYSAPTKLWWGSYNGNRVTDFYKTQASAKSAALREYNSRTRGDGVPWSPFQNPDDLLKLAMKAILSFACQIPEVAAVAWTNGVQQSVRNSRANHITGIRIHGDVKWGQNKFQVEVRTNTGWTFLPPDEETRRKAPGQWFWTPNRFRTVFGANLYEFIIPGFQGDLSLKDAQLMGRDPNAPKKPGGGRVEFTVEDLNMVQADDSYAEYYDRLLPSVVKKLTKKAGGRVVPVIETPIGSQNLDSVINLGVFKTPKLCATFAGDQPMLMFNPPV